MRGEFWRFTKRKRSHLLHKIERLKRRLSELRTQIKFATAGVATALLMAAGTASAQNTSTSPIGPFNPAPLKNPFPAPAFPRLDYPTLNYTDMDGDGDLDATVSSDNYYLIYYENKGNAQRALFKQPDDDNTFEQVDLEGYIGGDRTSVAYSDVDDDGDLDLLVGQSYTNITPDPDFLWFYRNSAGPNAKPYFETPGEHNPFDEVTLTSEGWPVFVDIDNDGDQDLVVAGRYYDSDNATDAWIQFFRNTKEGHAFDVDAIYEWVPPSENPLYTDASGIDTYLSIAFADLDEDGDMDFVYKSGDSGGSIRYKRNDNGVFVEQEGPWAYNPNNPGASTGNPFQNVVILSVDNKYRSMAFGDTDGDGDVDLTVGIRAEVNGTGGSSFVFVENEGHGVMTRSFALGDPVPGVDFGSNVGTSLVDYDHDGDLDMVISAVQDVATNECDSEFLNCLTERRAGHVIVRNDDGVYNPLVFQQDPFEGIQPDFGGEAPEGANLILVDIDSDSDLDALMMLKDSYPHLKYFKNEEGEYVELPVDESPMNFLHDGFQTIDVDFADLNGDGLLDMVLGERNRKLTAYRNTGEVGAPVFTLEPNWAEGFADFLSDYVHPKFIDLDNDGDMDIVVGKYRNIYYYENIGTATEPGFKEYIDNKHGATTPDRFKNPFTDIQIENGGSPDAPAPALVDVDNDGDRDLLFGNREGIMTYYENQNPTPVVTQGRSVIEFSPDDDILLDPTITLTDPDNDRISKIVIRITPFDQGKETLDFDDVYPDIEGNWNDDTGELTLTGTASIPDFQSALRSVVYSNSYDDNFERKGSERQAGGRSFVKTITFLALDSDLTTGTTSTAAYSIAHVNEEPVVSPVTFNVTYTNTPIPLISTITLADDDDTTLHSAEVAFATGSFRSAEDVLSINGSIAGINTDFDASNGVLHITGVGSVADYQSLLRTISYNNLLGTGATMTGRTLNVKVYDGESDSNLGVINLSMFTANVPPIISGAGSTFWTTGEIVINTGIVLSDVDDSTLEGASVTISSGFNVSEDALVFTDQNGITGTTTTGSNTLTLSGTSSVANYQAALRSVRYKNSSSNPSTANRGFTFTVTDGGTTTTLTGSLIVINKPPTITLPEKKTRAGGNVALGFDEIFSDPDDNLDLSTITVTSAHNAKITIEGEIITIDYTSQPTFEGMDDITFTVCDTGGRCTTETFSIEVGADPKIYTGMSPNNDGINDWFHIEFLPPGSRVTIFNRWGDAIFETADYDVNDAAKRFEGKNKNGTEVIGGSYFYKVEYAEGNQKIVKTGSLLLNR